ncbi:MAG: hypothetical protein HOV92_40245 [Streptomyces sp.]|nr:hypothetical protein [Streptomyces sp.]
MLTPYQQALRDRMLTAPVLPAPEPWRPVFASCAPVGGLLGIGFATRPDSHPDSANDLVMVVSHDGHGLFDAVTGEKIARERDPVGFSPSGHTLAVATSSDLTLWTRAGRR